MAGHKIVRWFVTGFGVGYLPIAPGTAGSLLGLLLFLPLQAVRLPYVFLFLLLLLGLGVYTIQLALPLFFKKKDPSEIVIDEIGAMLLILFMLPASAIWWGLGFLLFRLLDITKPLLIRKAEKLPGGWGVMADDLMAAVYTLLILRSIHYLIASSLL